MYINRYVQKYRIIFTVLNLVMFKKKTISIIKHCIRTLQTVSFYQCYKSISYASTNIFIFENLKTSYPRLQQLLRKIKEIQYDKEVHN